jgi:alkylation response protein AidB-like acyl-CoA dehydrogenase
MNDIGNDISDDMTNDMLRTVDRVCDTLCSRDLRESAEAGVWPAGLWQALAETGLDRVALPEAAGGPGLAFADTMAALKPPASRCRKAR